MKPIQITLPTEVHKQLKRLAIDRDTNVTKLIRGAIKDLLDGLK